MKKALCLILSLIITLCCCTVAAVSAAEVDIADEGADYLLGDADLDGDISVLDATAIQRDLADLDDLSGLQKELADVEGNGYDILSATLIQRHLADIPTGYAIGEEAGDVNEGVVYEETVPWYSCNDTIVCEEGTACFSTAYPDVAFITDKELINIFSAFFGYENGLEPLEGYESPIHTYHLATDTYVVFDYNKKWIYFSDYTTTLTVNGAMPYNPFSVLMPDETPLYKSTQKDHYYGGDPVIATFDYDEVPMLRHGSDILVPLQTFSDLFTSVTGNFFQYNGKGIFQVCNSTASDPNQKELWDLYCDTEKFTEISKEWAQVNYYELCNALDARYGLQAAHNIDSFDAYFARKGIKKQMLSGDLAAIEKATLMISILLFEDFHSSPSMSSPFLEKAIELDISMFSPLYLNRQGKMKSVENARSQQLGEPAPYERRGDTVFITFDAFTYSGFSPYFAEGYEPDPYSGDTIALFAYALRRLQNEDSDAKNVVIDISCNGGGTVIACAYALDAICGECIMCLQNPNTWALHQCDFEFDLNLDGSIDENDVSMKEMGKNVAVIISDHSFSCGNMLPCVLDELTDDVLLIGQTSGGGACEVGFLSTTTGAIVQLSSEQRFVTMKNGYIKDIDGGIAPDVYLSLSRMFDRDYIVDLVDDQFG